MALRIFRNRSFIITNFQLETIGILSYVLLRLFSRGEFFSVAPFSWDYQFAYGRWLLEPIIGSPLKHRVKEAYLLGMRAKLVED